LQELNSLIEIELLFPDFPSVFALDQISRGANARFPSLLTPMVTDSLVFIFAQHKMRGMPLSPASHCLAALPATMSAFNSTAATGFSTKSVDSQKNSRDLKQLHYIQKFYDEFCSFT